MYAAVTDTSGKPEDYDDSAAQRRVTWFFLELRIKFCTGNSGEIRVEVVAKPKKIIQ